MKAALVSTCRARLLRNHVFCHGSVLAILIGLAVAPPASAVVIFSEDFDDITLTTDPLPLDTNTPNSAFTTSVVTNDNSIVAARTAATDYFGEGPGNAFLHLVDGSGVTAGVRGPTISSTGKLIHLAFDFLDTDAEETPFEETITSATRIYLNDNGGGTSSTRSIDFQLNNGEIYHLPATGNLRIGTYTEGVAHRFEVIGNFSDEVIHYYLGGQVQSVAPKSYDFFVDGEVVSHTEGMDTVFGDDVAFKNAEADTVTHFSIFGNGSSSRSEGYVDNIVITEMAPFPLALTIDRNTGQAILQNVSTEDITFLGYEILSTTGALETQGSKTIAGNYDAGSPDELDPDDTWTVLTNTSLDHTNSVAEYVFPAPGQANNGLTLGAGQQIDFGTVWIPTANESELSAVFQTLTGSMIPITISYAGNGDQPLSLGDLNHDGVIDTNDWLIFNSNDPADDLSFTSIARAYGMGDLDGDMDIDTVDYRLFESAYDAANGAGSFLAMVQGQAVPEPSTLMVLALGLPLAVALRRSYAALRLCLLGMAVAWSLTGMSQAQTVEFRFTDNTELDNAPVGTSMVRSPDDGLFNRITLTTTDARAPEYSNSDLDWDQVSYIPAETYIHSASGMLINNPGSHSPPSDSGGVNQYETFSLEFNRYVRVLELDFSSLNESDGDEGVVSVEGLVSPLVFNSTTLDEDSDLENPFGNLIIPAGTDFTFTGRGSTTDGESAWRLVGITVQELLPELTARVDSQSGEVLLVNTGDIPLAFDSYELRSSDAALRLGEGGWNSLSNQGLDSIGEGIGESWDEGTNVSASIVVERFLLGETALAPDEFVSLGNLYDPEIGSIENLSLFFSDKLTHGLTGLVELIGSQVLPGDFNIDGVVDAADYTVWRNHLGGDDAVLGGNGHTNGVVDAEDYTLWKTHFGTSSGGGALGLASAQVPEPSSVVLLMLAAGTVLHFTRRQRLTLVPAKLAALGVVAVVGATTAQGVTVDRYYSMGDYNEGGVYEGTSPSNGPEESPVQSSTTGDVLDAVPTGVGDAAHLTKSSPTGPIYAGVGVTGNYPREGATGYAIEFSGQGDYLSSIYPLNIISTNGETPSITQGMQMWVYVKPDNLGVSRQVLVSDTLNSGGPAITASGLWTLNLSNHDNDTQIEATVPVIPDKWHHVAQHIYLDSDANAPTVIPGSGNAPYSYTSVVYVNGIAVSASNDSSTASGTNTFLVGAEGATPTNFFSGVIDELTVYTSGPNEFNLLTDNEFIAAELPIGYQQGDINLDGNVGSADVTAFVNGWRKEKRFGGAHNDLWVGDLETLGWGDINLDGRVDLSDAYLLNQALQANGAGSLNFSLLSGGGAVPEPSSVVLLLGTVIAGAVVVNRRRRG